ncbi:AI-2E family transporter [Simiduia agarivorans]|uniref:Membrane protein, PerM family n=1 Tax=Simiduia agarivorans (strain DSM 21679 / JCM 13881 / BCRC 17597 / SA1) TaxID=1117647 RepID=K4KGY6_SIMAS|nr:AI-2E family transporter [Simiduia agarivorans]AFU98369.1 membrane protein, PerM family [Simiduia agarivorans SA1 = DSM 21679]
MLKIFRNWTNRYFYDEEALVLLLLLVLGLALVVTMGTVLAPAIAALILAFLLQGLVQRLVNWGMRHILAVWTAFLVLVGLITSAVLVLFPILWRQMGNLIEELPRMVADAKAQLAVLPQRYPDYVSPEHVQQFTNLANHELGTVGQSLLSVSVASVPLLITALIYFVLVPILVFFFLKDQKLILNWMSGFLPRKRPIMQRVWLEMNDQIANYVRGKAVEILIVAAVSYASFSFMGLRYSLLLAIAVGLSVLVPYIGAAVVTLPVVLVGLWQWGLSSEFYWLLLVYGIIQALDGNVLVPVLFSEAVNLHPVAIIIAVLAFGGIWGFWGVFFAIPLATLLKAVINAWPSQPNGEGANA